MNTDKSGSFESGDESNSLIEHEFQFELGELDRLIAESEASEPLDGEAVLAELRKLHERSRGR